MSESDSDSSGEVIKKEWTFVNRYGELEVDRNTTSSDDRSICSSDTHSSVGDLDHELLTEAQQTTIGTTEMPSVDDAELEKDLTIDSQHAMVQQPEMLPGEVVVEEQLLQQQQDVGIVCVSSEPESSQMEPSASEIADNSSIVNQMLNDIESDHSVSDCTENQQNFDDSHEVVSSSSGSSIELLDLSDDGSEDESLHSADQRKEHVEEVDNTAAEENDNEMMGMVGAQNGGHEPLIAGLGTESLCPVNNGSGDSVIGLLDLLETKHGNVMEALGVAEDVEMKCTVEEEELPVEAVPEIETTEMKTSVERLEELGVVENANEVPDTVDSSEMVDKTPLTHRSSTDGQIEERPSDVIEAVEMGDEMVLEGSLCVECDQQLVEAPDAEGPVAMESISSGSIEMVNFGDLEADSVTVPHPDAVDSADSDAAIAPAPAAVAEESIQCEPPAGNMDAMANFCYNLFFRDKQNVEPEADSDDDDVDDDQLVEDDIEALAADENVDDRCESDISGIASDDTDLSTVSNIGDLPVITDSDTVRLYRHQPNTSFDTLLTLITVLAVCFAVGIGVGHYFGSTRISSLHEQQVVRLKALQDEQFLCLSQLETVEARLANATEMEKRLSAVTAVWRRKYEELISERAQLEWQLADEKQTSKKTMAYYQWRLDVSRDAIESVTEKAERLTADLIIANQTLLVTAAETDVYRTDIINARQDQERLELQLATLRAQLESWKLAADTAQSDMERVEKEKKSAEIVSGMLKDELLVLKNIINQMKVENAELKTEVLSLRYMEHPGNAVPESVLSEDGVPVKDGTAGSLRNNLRPTGTDRAKDGGSSAASSVNNGIEFQPIQLPNGYDSTFDDGTTDTAGATDTAGTTDTASADQLSKQFVRLLQLLSGVEAELKSNSSSIPVSNKQTVYVTLLRHLLTFAANSTDLEPADQMARYSEALRQVADCVEIIHNISEGHGFVKMMASSWNQLSAINKTGITGKVVDDETRTALTTCQKRFASTKKRKGKSSKMQDIFQRYVNRTMETVNDLSRKIQTTLKQVRKLPDEIFSDNKTAQKIGRKLKEAVNRLDRNIKSGWKQVRDNFASIRKKWFGFSAPTCKQKNGGKGKGQSKKEPSTKQQQTGKTEKEKPVVEEFVLPDGKFEEKHDHKQTESTPGEQFGPEPNGGNGFWQSASHHAPEDYIPEGFFEGNQHEFHRKFEKIRDRIERLNEEMYLSMDDDDDDIEDIYEDLKDLLEEDGVKRDVAIDLQAWMTCQLRWWKTRLHRKHRTEDLIKGCGRQLMHWQLRVICKLAEERDEGKVNDIRDLCTVIMSSPSSPRHTTVTDSMDSPTGTSRQAETQLESAELDGDYSAWNEMWPFLADSAWYFRLMQDRDDNRPPSSKWYFNRVEDRELSRANTNWYVRAIHHRSVADIDLNSDHRRQRGAAPGGN